LHYSQEFPTVLRHLADHCPRITHLTLDSSLLLKFSMLAPLFARLLGRVTHLSFVADRTLETTDERLVGQHAVAEFFQIVKQIFEAVDGTPRLTHLIFDDLTCDGHVGHEVMSRIMRRLPVLMECVLPIFLSAEEAKEMFGNRPSLRRLRIFGQHDSVESVSAYITALSSTDLGINFGISPGFTIMETLLETPLRPKGAAFFRNLFDSGLRKALEPADVVNVIQYLIRESEEEAEGVIRLLVARSSRLLPGVAEVASCLHSLPNHETFWPDAVRTGHFALFRLCLDVFGAPQVSQFKLLAYAVSRTVFDVAFVDAIRGCDPATPLDVMAADPDNHNLFHCVRTEEALEWLLHAMSEEDAYRLMHHLPKEANKAYKKPIASLLARFDTVLVKHFKSHDILSLTNDSDSLFHAATLIQHSNTANAFKRIVKATWPHVSSSIAADILLLTMPTPSMFHYWISFMDSNGLVPDFSNPSPNESLADALKYASSSFETGPMLTVLLKYDFAIVKSFVGMTSESLKSSALPHLAKFLHIHWPAATGREIYTETDEKMQKVFETVFTPIVRQLADSGVPSSHLVLDLSLPFPVVIVNPNYSLLLRLCLELDFKSQPNAALHESAALLLAEALSSGLSMHVLRADQWIEAIFIPCVPCLTASALNCCWNGGQSVMDILLSQNQLPSSLSAVEFIDDLVLRGGRLHIVDKRTTSSSAAIYDEAMLELYRDAMFRLLKEGPIL
jgi:hypothetical protein